VLAERPWGIREAFPKLFQSDAAATMALIGPFEFGSFRLDPEKSVLWQGGDLVPLTPKALAVLAALADARGDVLSKPELMARVWPDTAVGEANLSVTVAALRKRIDPQPGGGSWIETVPRRGYRFGGPFRASGDAARLSLAVLPFACLGPGTESHLGLGMADALIGRLTAFDGLLVRPTGAVAHYAGSPKAPREAARELGVDAVVTGTVQRDAGRVRLSVQLVPRPASLRPWADSFDADWTDLFAVQDALAERMAQALRPRLGPAGAASRRHTPTPDAFEAYLLGRYFWSRFDPEHLGKAFACFGEAAQLDPLYAAPLSGLADSHLMLGLAGLRKPRDAWRVAAECAERALAQDRSHAEAHVSRAYARLFGEWAWDEARADLERAIAIHPGSASVHLWLGLFLAISGDLAGARDALARARHVDPLSGVSRFIQGVMWGWAGDHRRQLELARRAVELRPHAFFGHYALGMACVELGRYTAGLKALRRAVALALDGPVMRGQLAWALATAGEESKAREELRALDALEGATFVSPCQCAAVLLALGERQLALARLERGAAERDWLSVFLKASPAFRPLAGDPRFEALVAQVGIPARR
jgi:DNA-binding winged helix-turn-helix (wHTH) protein/tetratricopeptide (TPR) repeat protein